MVAERVAFLRDVGMDGDCRIAGLQDCRIALSGTAGFDGEGFWGSGFDSGRNFPFDFKGSLKSTKGEPSLRRGINGL